MKKVLLCVNSLGSGGAERQIFLLATNLPKNWRVHIFSLANGYFYNKLIDLGISVSIHPRKHKFDLQPFWDLRETVLSFKPDIVHSWDWMQAIAISVLCRKSQMSHIVGIIRSGRVPPRRWLGLLLASRTGSITIANSNAGLKAFRLLHTGRVIYNGIDVNRFSSASLRNTDHAIGKSRCVMLASFLPSKDHDSLFKAGLYLHKRISIQIVSPGNGPLLSSYQNKYKDLVDSGSISLPGFCEDINTLLASCTVGILVSNASEGLSNSIMEYMGAGLPVICTNSGGNPELVQDGVNGFLINRGDWKTLARRIEWLYKNPYAAFEMGKKGRELLLANFSTKKMVSETVFVYEMILKKENK